MQERVARHLAMVAFLIEEDPELAHQHALSASRRAGRIPVTRETLAITAYRTGDFALALRELRTYRRLSGLDNHVALMVDCERGLGRPERAIETGLAADASTLDTEQRVHLAIAMSGARLDLGQTQQALFELEIPELNPAKAFSWSSHLFGAYAAVLEDLGRESEAAEWEARSEQAANAVQNLVGAHDELEVFEIYETEYDAVEETDEDFSDDTDAAQDADPTGDADVSKDTGLSQDTDAADEGDDSVGEAILEDSAFADSADESAGNDAEPAVADISIEDEVDELLAEAGIIDSDELSAENQDGNEQEAK
ncbi:hypothetical protein G7066_04240 [Leucobacter coleopterorum]|uniref:Tetratrico peptide repeat-containing protein n=1 Tax=Leucobacter coleopterorum TaxID=2714933 RepID=A0ABX6JZA4_9MICO|nr:hypothetical protein G7066_04240 [Leucobacter coleopterorum]